MKRVISLFLTVLFALAALSGCGCDGGAEAEVVFVNGSDMDIIAVLVDFQERSSGAQNADSSPLRRGESFGFEAGEYPATVMVYDRAAENSNEKALARLTIDSAPPEGGRWYVTARDDGNGLTLDVDTEWPEGV